MKDKIVNLLWAAVWAAMAMLTGDIAIEAWSDGSTREAGAIAVFMFLLSLLFIIGTCIFYLLGTSSLQPIGYRREGTLALLIFIATLLVLFLAGFSDYTGLTTLLAALLAALPILRRRAQLS